MSYHDARLSFILCGITACCFFGCTPDNRPEGLPDLHSCVITITQDGTPLPDASIQLYDRAGGIWPVTGTTDASGNAALVTYGQFPGAPVGEYAVTVSKREIEESGQADEYRSGTTRIYSLIDVDLADLETTPLKISVGKGKTRESFEIGKPVRVLVDTISPGT